MVSDRILISIPSVSVEPLEMCGEAGDALAHQSGAQRLKIC